jgi:hypothetical protein
MLLHTIPPCEGHKLMVASVNRSARAPGVQSAFRFRPGMHFCSIYCTRSVLARTQLVININCCTSVVRSGSPVQHDRHLTCSRPKTRGCG